MGEDSENIKPAPDSDHSENCARVKPICKDALALSKQDMIHQLTNAECHEQLIGMKVQYKSLLVVLSEIKKAFTELKTKFNDNNTTCGKLMNDMSFSLEKKDQELACCKVEMAAANETITKLKEQGAPTAISLTADHKQEISDLKAMLEIKNQLLVDYVLKLDLADEKIKTFEAQTPVAMDRSAERVDTNHGSVKRPSCAVSEQVENFLTPRPHSRIGRKSFIRGENAAFNATIADMSSRDVSFEEIAIKQKEVLDCYALLCGLSVKYSSDMLTSEDNVDDDTLLAGTKRSPDIFSCAIECGTNMDGMNFQLSVDYEFNQFSYVPCMKGNEKFSLLPEFMRENIYFDIHEAPMLLKRILTCIAVKISDTKAPS